MTMPELPDVEVYRRRLTASGRLRKRVDEVRVDDERMLDMSPTTLRRHLKGNRLVDPRVHGKWLLTRIDGDGSWLAMHFGMTGDLASYGKDDDPPRYERLRLTMSDGGRLGVVSRRLLGGIELTKDPERFAEAHALGPDARSLDADGFLKRLEGRSGAIKNVLMDQSVLAGIGNVYSDEALFHAHIDPRRKVTDLDERELRRLHGRLQYVIQRAVEAQADRGRMPNTWLLPHRRRKDADCPRCGIRLEHGKVGGRTTLWCPKESD